MIRTFTFRRGLAPMLILAFTAMLATGAGDVTFEQWRDGAFPPASSWNRSDMAVTGSRGDANKDGTSNMMSFALGLDANVSAAAGLPVQAVESGHLTLTFTRRKDAPELEYIPQVSGDSINWNSGAAHIETVSVTDQGATELVKVRDIATTAASAQRFMRLKVVPHFVDADSDGLPDWWENQFGLDPADDGTFDPANGPLGDPDGDGIDNFAEYDNQTVPVPQGGSAGVLQYHRWTITVPPDRLGWITDLTRSGALGRTPDQSATVDLAEISTTQGGGLGSRIRGTVTAPVSGNYQFAIAGSHVAELWLGASESRFGRVRIASVPSPTDYRNFTSFPSQLSAPVPLVAGQKYYIEALGVHAHPGNHLSVAWKVIGNPPGSLLGDLTVIGLQYLGLPASNPNDLDDDGLPDDWELANGLDPLDAGQTDPGNGEYGDPDGDLLSNFREYQLGTNPTQATSLAGNLQRQLWRDANVFLVREFRQNPKILGAADIWDVTPGAEAPQGIPGNAAQRLRGWLTAPVTGNYTLYIAGSKNCELWLGAGESKFGKVMVSQVIDREGTEPHEWTRIAGQGSDPLPLVAGQKYYIEAMQLTRGSNDHMTIGWKRPDAGVNDPVEVIPPQFVSSFVKSAEDLDDDDLPDAWETQHGLGIADNGSGLADNGPFGDQDLDGVPNWMEYVAGTSPVNPSTNGTAPDSSGMHGFLSRNVWNDIPNPLVATLTSGPKFVSTPDISDFVQMAESRYNAGPWFGERLRGRVIAPVTGQYTFWISGDNQCELWLSPAASKFQRVKIAANPAVTSGHGEGGLVHFREWRKYAMQRSAPVTLSAGQEYYIEVLHKQENDGDHLSVGWNLPGQDPNTVDPQVIQGSALRSNVPEADDVNDNGLPDSWEISFAINGLPYPDGGEYGDPDHDGINNFEEYQLGSSPVVSGGFVGALERQLWWDIGGVTARDIVQVPRFLQTPDEWDLIQGAEAPQDIMANDGQRLRGVITAPVSGVYTFHIAGSGSSELWLGTGESKFSRAFVAQVVLPTDPHEWTKYTDQASAPVTLVAGQRYYVEVLAKEPAGSQSHHLSIGWKRPDAAPGDPVEVIPAQFLTSFGRSADDLDDDDLPDAWETSFGLSATDNGAVSPDNGAFGDPDNDGIPNWLESLAGTSPVNPSTNGLTPDGGAPGVLSRQVWTNVPGVKISDLTLSADFGGTPDTRDFVVSAESRVNAGGDFGERLRGRVIAPVSGQFTFWISGDNECELWLSPTSSKFQRVKIASVPGIGTDPDPFRDFDKDAPQQSAPITLVAGQEYYIEILHKQGNDGDHLSVAWSYPGQARQIIRGSALRGYVPEADDVDDDGLPDSWEVAVGLNPADNGLINPNDGSYGDPDEDGYNNFAEYTNNTNPFASNAVDTDGDGISDYDETYLYFTNPNVADATPPSLLGNIPLAGFQATAGTWAPFPGGTLRSFTRRGPVSFSFQFDDPGVYVVELKASAFPADRYTPHIPIIARVDGIEVGRAEVRPFGSRHLWLTPRLTAGTHTVTIDNRNVRTGVSMGITSITIYKSEGADADTNAIPDWMQSRFLGDGHFDPGSNDSPTSPFCIEGTARLAGDARVFKGAEEIPAYAGLAGRWYANVPLDPSADTPITATFENGALSEQRTLHWTTTNLFTAPATIRVRMGDSLKVTAVPNGESGQQTTSSFTLDGAPVGVPGPALDPRVVLFDTAGTFTLAASAVTDGNTLDVSVQVEVVAANFGPAFSLASGYSRVWELPGVPHTVDLSADTGLNLQEIGRDPDQSRKFTVSYPDGSAASPRVLARLPGGGPIVTATTVNAFRFVPLTITGNTQVIEVLTDGTRVVEVRYVIDGPIPSDLSIWLSIFTVGASFANGGSEYELTAADFDASGEARLLVHFIPGAEIPRVCHLVLPYFHSSVGNHVWRDENGNGIRDAGEPGIASVTVELLNQGGVSVQTAVTDAQGHFVFTHLEPGQYRLRFPVSLPGGLALTGANLGGDDAKDSDADSTTGLTPMITLGGGDNDMTWDAGYHVP